MAELHLKGYITTDYDGIVSLSEKPEDYLHPWENKCESIVSSIENFANEHGLFGYHDKGLGGKRSYIDDCNIRIYFTDKECSLEEAMLAFDALMYGGDIKTKVDNVGYSEWTITGMVIDEFSIGGHDLEYEIHSHYGKYAHIIIEC